MELKYLTKNELNLWNKFVYTSPQGSIFSYTWYLDALQANYDVLVVLEKGNIFAGIVLAKNEVNTYSNPMLDKYLGILFKNEENLSQKLISRQYKAMEMLAEELKKYKSFDYYFHPAFNNWIPFYWHGFAQQTRYTYRLNISNDIQKIFHGFHGNLRNDIKNAIKNNINIQQNIKFDFFFDLINKTFIRQGSKAPFAKIKVENFLSQLSRINRFISFGAYDQKKNLIAVCGIVYDNKASYLLLNGIDINNQIRGANALLIFETIKYFQNKVQWYDFEGSMLKGVEQFYRRFGGELTPYYRIWNDNFFNYAKSKAKKLYKKLRYGR